MSPELWGGIECTVNRVGNRYYDQTRRTGHEHRIDDLQLIADLGIRTLRYPVLWERTERDGGLDFTWAHERVNRLAELKITPIVGLLHHGSGPRHTSLIDPEFPEKFSLYARAVAERFPWIEHYTPINEPLTTARFSGLYGHWYPHGKSDYEFALAIIHQCRAILLAMREIRHVNPDARLIQTEDLGKTFSTEALAGQACFENQRRWLSFDLLCGRVYRGHPMWSYLRRLGITEGALYWFLENACPPDVVGVNYYVTSERFLDERLYLYPESLHGGNSVCRYADVEAIRVGLSYDFGPAARLAEIWQRYSLPVAVTEVHLGSTVEERLRWFYHIWKSAEKQIAVGADIRAVTAWALFGSFNWNNLCVRDDNTYEAGVFDVSTGVPANTLMTDFLRRIAPGGAPNHPALSELGWWMKPERILYPTCCELPGILENKEGEISPHVQY
jgi:dTDP-4-dehydrorhamnose reductase